MARYRQSPNYIAKKSLWPAFDWWNVMIYMMIIPTAIIIMQIVMPELCSWYIALALYALVPFTVACMERRLSFWNVLCLIILIPGGVAGICVALPALGDKILNEWLANWWVVLALWLIFPITICVVKIIILKCKCIEFYDSYVIERSGVFTKHTKKSVFPEVTSVTTKKNILGYGDVYIDVIGPWDVSFDDMRRPDDLRDYLVYHMLNAAAVENISNNPYIAATDGLF